MAEAALAIATLASAYAMSRKPNASNNTTAVGALPTNYPIDAKNVSHQNPNIYAQPANQSTDRYFQSDCSTTDKGATFVSLTGEVVSSRNFTHNNCVPYFGARLKGGSANQSVSNALLDNLAGAGSQQRRKRETAPLFKPQKDLHWAHGMPSTSEFLLSRQIPSSRMANVKPWEEQKVSPGLGNNKQALGGGYNTAVQDREAWLPKTVSELRVKTNPKETFGLAGHEGPAVSGIKSISSASNQGIVNKNRPDTYYKLGPSRWFTTKGAESGQTHRSEVMQHDQDRGLCDTNYFGGGSSDARASYINSHTNESKKKDLGTQQPGPCVGQPHGQENEVSSYENKCTNRSSTMQRTVMGPIKGAVAAIVSPILDVVRHTRKSNFIGTGRLVGNPQSLVSSVPYSNTQNKLKTTLKEQTGSLLGADHLNYQAQASGRAHMAKDAPREQNRGTVQQSEPAIAGPAMAGSSQGTYYDPSRLGNTRKQTASRYPAMSGFRSVGGPIERTRMKVADKGGYTASPHMTQHWAPAKAPSIGAVVPHMTKVRDYESPSCKGGRERIDAGLLSAFKSNPYTHSLSSY